MKTMNLFLAGVATLVYGSVGTSVAQRPGGIGGFLRMPPIIDALDKDGDGVISTKEIDSATQALKELDKDDNGKLTEEELRPEFGQFRGIRRESEDFDGGPGRDSRGAKSEQMVSRLMNFDENKDGKLSKEELPKRLHNLLSRADANQDDFATKEELAKLNPQDSRARRGGPGGPPGSFSEGGRRGSEAFVKRALRFDEDKDGRLNKKELAKLGEQFGRRRGSVREHQVGRERENDRPRRPRLPISD